MNNCLKEYMMGKLLMPVLLGLVYFLTSSCVDKEPYEIDSESDIYISNPVLNLNSYSNEASFVVQNNVSKAYELTLITNEDILELSQSTIFLEAFAAAKIDIRVKVDVYSGDSILLPIRILYQNDVVDTILVTYKNYSFSQETFDFPVTDVQYCKYNESLVFLSDGSEKRIYIYDTQEKVWNNIQLEDTPVGMCVSPTKPYVAVALSNKKVLYVDLDRLRIIKEYLLEDQLFAIVLSSNEWIYGFTGGVDEQYDYYSIDIMKDDIFRENVLHGLSKLIVKLHPDETEMYGLLEWWSSSNVTYKFVLENNKIVDIVSNSHTYDFRHRFWYSADGKYLVGKTGLYFTRTDDSYNFLEPQGQFTDLGYSIASFAHSKLTDMAYAVNIYVEHWSDDDTKSELLSYDIKNNAYMGKVELPMIRKEGDGNDLVEVEAMPQYVFFSSDYSCLFVVSAPASSQGVSKWAISTVYQ